MKRFTTLFNNKKNVVIGMVHVKPLPGSPLYETPLPKVLDDACQEAEIYKKTGVDGIIVENMYDIPYVRSKDLGPETVSLMTRICCEVRKIIPSNLPCGVQVLAGCNKEALAVAKASGFQFIRSEGYVFSHIADEGLIEASAGPLLRYRKLIDADDIMIYCDIKKKHSSHATTSDISIGETAKAAKFFLCDGVIITGQSTGDPADSSELIKVKEAEEDLPVFVGSGLSEDNVEKFKRADGYIVGSFFKKSGRWDDKLSEDKINRFVEKVHSMK